MALPIRLCFLEDEVVAAGTYDGLLDKP